MGHKVAALLAANDGTVCKSTYSQHFPGKAGFRQPEVDAAFLYYRCERNVAPCRS